MAKRIQTAIDKHGVVLMPGCFDALSARILAHLDFAAGFISGYAVSAARLGRPDVGLLTQAEMALVARHVCEAAGSMPIIADADTGGGNPLNVQRTIRELIAAGAAGCFLEDQVWPKKCGHMAGKRVIPKAEHVQKIRAAVDAIGDADFFLVARTDARAAVSFDDAIDRMNAYMEAGADGSFVEAPQDDDELRRIARETPGPRVANMVEGGKTPLHTPAELKELGFQLIVHPLTGLYGATRAMLDLFGALKNEGTTREHLPKLATFSEFNELIDLQSVYDAEKKYDIGD